MLAYFLDKKPWKFVVFITAVGCLFSIMMAGIATWIVYQKISWFIEIVAFIIPLLAGPALSISSIKFIKNYQREKDNQKSILEIIDNIDDLFFLADKKGELFYVNQTMQKKLGFSKDELIGKSILGIHPEIEKVKILKLIGILLKNKQYSCRTYLKCKDNSTLPVETSAKILKWNNKPVTVCVSRDISEQQKMIHKLMESEARFREFSEMLPELVCEADENGIITFANRNAIDRFGYTKDNLESGIHVLDLLIPEDREKAENNLKRRIKNELNSIQEYTALRKDKTTFPCLVILAPIYTNDKLSGFRGLMIDITERKEKEKQLQKTLNFVNNLIENIPLGVLIFNSDENCVSVNKGAIQILNLNKDKTIGKKISELSTSFNNLANLVSLCSTNQSLINQKVEIKYEFEDENIWLDCTALPNTTDDFQHIILIVNDITQQVEYERELKKLNFEISTQNMSYLAQNSEMTQINKLLKENQKSLNLKTSELEFLINNIKIQIWYLKNPYEYGAVNQEHANFIGKKIEEISYKPIAEALQSNMLGDAIKNSLTVYKTKSSLFKEIWTFNAQGEKRLLSMTFSPSINENNEVDFIVCSAIDITLERLAEEKIKKNLLHQEYITNISNLFNSLEDSDIIIDKAIALMEKITKSSRVYVLENSSSIPDNFRLFEWLDDGISSHFNSIKEKINDDYEFLKNRLIENGNILSNNTESIENEIGDYLKNRNIKSVLVFPIIANDIFYGVIGMDECHEARNWEKLEIELLRILSNLLGNYLAKQEILEKLRFSEQFTIEAKDAAEKANVLKSEFLANMSHEIRTPMNAILGYAKLLSKTLLDKGQKEHIEIIRDSGKNLLALINDILDLSKIEAGKMKIENKPLSPRKIIDEIQNIFKLKAKEKGIEFITEINPKIPEAIILDEIRLRQVLFNLVGNAIKFTNKGYVKLSVTGTSLDKQNNKINLSFTVEDTGIGIAENQVNDIFKSFKQQEGQSGKFEGTGLGLTITRKLVDMMDGFVTVSSKLGLGSQFTVELFEVKTSNQIILEEEIINQKIDFLQAKVLLVEDNIHNQELVKYFLKDNNILFYVANNGKEAIKFLETIIPDLILMDIKMPVMDGYEATKIIKSKSEWMHIPVISMSANVLPEDKILMKEVGTSGFVPKPIDDIILCRELSKFLKHKVTGHSNNSNVNNDEFDFNLDLDKLDKKKLQPLLDILKNDLYKKWKDNSRSMQIQKWKSFAEEIIEIGKEYDCNSLKEYGKGFITSINIYNIKKLKNQINLYEKILQTIENFQ